MELWLQPNKKQNSFSSVVSYEISQRNACAFDGHVQTPRRLPANAPTCSGQLFLYIKIKIIAKDRDAFLLFNTNLFS